MQVGDWVDNPRLWCKTADDLVRWCTDQVPEEPRVDAPVHLRFLGRVIEATAERALPEGANEDFRVGDLTYTAWQTRSITGRLSGTLVTEPDPDHPAPLPEATLEVTLARTHAYLRLRGPDISPSVGGTVPMALTPFRDVGPWEGLATTFSEPEKEAHWWLLLTPAYHHGE